MQTKEKGLMELFHSPLIFLYGVIVALALALLITMIATFYEFIKHVTTM